MASKASTFLGPMSVHRGYSLNGKEKRSVE